MVFSALNTLYIDSNVKCMRNYSIRDHPLVSSSCLPLPTLSISLPDAHPTLTVPPGYPLPTLPSASALNPALVPPHRVTDSSLVFRGDVCHNGLGYASENVRLHAYVYPSDHKPGASSINSCHA